VNRIVEHVFVVLGAILGAVFVVTVLGVRDNWLAGVLATGCFVGLLGAVADRFRPGRGPGQLDE
jgi:hypothetical protein